MHGETVYFDGIGIFDLFVCLDTHDAKCTREIKSRTVKATATINKKILFSRKWT